MFILDSLMIAGIRWALETALTAAEAEMNDDSVLREQLLEAEMRREMGDISDEEFSAIEADLLARIREIKERREGGSGPLQFGGQQPLEAAGGDQFKVEASVSGDFHDAADTPHTTVLEPLPHHRALGNLVDTTGEERISVLDMEPGDAAPPVVPARARQTKTRATTGTARTTRATRTTGTTGTSGTTRTSGTKRTAGLRRASKNTLAEQKGKRRRAPTTRTGRTFRTK